MNFSLNALFTICLLFSACNQITVVNVNSDLIIQSVLKEFLLDDPPIYFLKPPTHPDTSGDRTYLNVAKFNFGIEPELNDVFYSKETLNSMDEIYKEIGCNLDKKISFISTIKIDDISRDLNLNLTKRNGDRKSRFRNVNKSFKGFFEFTEPVLLECNKSEVYSITMFYNCGRMCGIERTYFLTLFDGKMVVLGYEDINKGI